MHKQLCPVSVRLSIHAPPHCPTHAALGPGAHPSLGCGDGLMAPNDLPQGSEQGGACGMWLGTAWVKFRLLP